MMDVPSHNDALPTPEAALAAGAQRGIVIRAHGLWFEVLGDNGDVRIATLRGQLKRFKRRTDVVAVGDYVWFSELPDNEAAIEAVEPRSRALVRTARHTRDTEQVILANPDQVLFMFAARNPEPHLRMLDRFIILGEMQNIPIQIAVTKIDLGSCAREHFADYEAVYPVHYVSSLTGEGIDELRAALEGKVSAIAGPSGVGKSSLLNVLDPGTDRAIADVSEATGKGRHTTIGAQLYQIGKDTFVADTPGMRALAMHAIPAESLDRWFREFQPYLGLCFYPDCTHVHEPRCAVREAVAADEIAQPRYDSYVALRTGDELQGTPR